MKNNHKRPKILPFPHLDSCYVSIPLGEGVCVRACVCVAKTVKKKNKKKTQIKSFDWRINSSLKKPQETNR